MVRIRSVYLDAMYLGGRKIRKDVATEMPEDEFDVWRAANKPVELALQHGAIALFDEHGAQLPYEPPTPPAPPAPTS